MTKKITEGIITNVLSDYFTTKKGYVTASELYLDIPRTLHYDYLESRQNIRIDLAVYNQLTGTIIFIEAENGLWLTHPQIYKPFCNRLYLACPADLSSYRQEQLNWATDQGIGVLEIDTDKHIHFTLEAKYNQVTADVREEVKKRCSSRLKQKGEKIYEK